MTDNETRRSLEQLRRQILGVLDGIERQMGIKLRTAEMRRICKECLSDNLSPAELRDRLTKAMN